MTIVYIILAIVAVIILLMVTLPSSYIIEKEIVINSPVDQVYDKIADLNHYKDWNPWAKMEPTASKTISGTPKTVGHIYKWEGKKIGEGMLTIKSLENNKSVVLDLQFFKPFKSIADDIWSFEDLGNNKTKVIWKNTGGLPAGMARLMGPMIKGNLNKQFVEGLNNIKAICEN